MLYESYDTPTHQEISVFGPPQANVAYFPIQKQRNFKPDPKTETLNSQIYAYSSQTPIPSRSYSQRKTSSPYNPSAGFSHNNHELIRTRSHEWLSPYVRRSKAKSASTKKVPSLTNLKSVNSPERSPLLISKKDFSSSPAPILYKPIPKLNKNSSPRSAHFLKSFIKNTQVSGVKLSIDNAKKPQKMLRDMSTKKGKIYTSISGERAHQSASILQRQKLKIRMEREMSKRKEEENIEYRELPMKHLQFVNEEVTFKSIPPKDPTPYTNQNYLSIFIQMPSQSSLIPVQKPSSTLSRQSGYPSPLKLGPARVHSNVNILSRKCTISWRMLYEVIGKSIESFHKQSAIIVKRGSGAGQSAYKSRVNQDLLSINIVETLIFYSSYNLDLKFWIYNDEHGALRSLTNERKFKFEDFLRHCSQFSIEDYNICILRKQLEATPCTLQELATLKKKGAPYPDGLSLLKTPIREYEHILYTHTFARTSEPDESLPAIFSNLDSGVSHFEYKMSNQNDRKGLKCQDESLTLQMWKTTSKIVQMLQNQYPHYYVKEIHLNFLCSFEKTLFLFDIDPVKSVLGRRQKTKKKMEVRSSKSFSKEKIQKELYISTQLDRSSSRILKQGINASSILSPTGATQGSAKSGPVSNALENSAIHDLNIDIGKVFESKIEVVAQNVSGLETEKDQGIIFEEDMDRALIQENSQDQLLAQAKVKQLTSIIKSTLQDGSDTSSKLSYDLVPKLLRKREVSALNLMKKQEIKVHDDLPSKSEIAPLIESQRAVAQMEESNSSSFFQKAEPKRIIQKKFYNSKIENKELSFLRQMMPSQRLSSNASIPDSNDSSSFKPWQPYIERPKTAAHYSKDGRGTEGKRIKVNRVESAKPLKSKRQELHAKKEIELPKEVDVEKIDNTLSPLFEAEKDVRATLQLQALGEQTKAFEVKARLAQLSSISFFNDQNEGFFKINKPQTQVMRKVPKCNANFCSLKFDNRGASVSYFQYLVFYAHNELIKQVRIKLLSNSNSKLNIGPVPPQIRQIFAAVVRGNEICSSSSSTPQLRSQTRSPIHQDQRFKTRGFIAHQAIPSPARISSKTPTQIINPLRNFKTGTPIHSTKSKILSPTDSSQPTIDIDDVSMLNDGMALIGKQVNPSPDRSRIKLKKQELEALRKEITKMEQRRAQSLKMVCTKCFLIVYNLTKNFGIKVE